jgi:sugar/nucleoside kinase (ribokinase family)
MADFDLGSSRITMTEKSGRRTAVASKDIERVLGPEIVADLERSVKAAYVTQVQRDILGETDAVEALLLILLAAIVRVRTTPDCAQHRARKYAGDLMKLLDAADAIEACRDLESASGRCH